MTNHDITMKAHELHQLIVLLPHFGELNVEKIAVPSETIARLNELSTDLMKALLSPSGDGGSR